MTEAEWFECQEIGRLVSYVDDVATERKLRLLAHACCCRIAHLLVDQPSRAALDALERYADELCGLEELTLCHSHAKEAVDAIEAPLYGDDGILHANEYSSAACAVLCAVAPDLSPTRKEAFYHAAISSVSYWSTAAAAGMELRRTGDRSSAEASEKAESSISTVRLYFF
jgi:hypothetical protein